jgi:hypothetical protein
MNAAEQLRTDARRIRECAARAERRSDANEEYARAQRLDDEARMLEDAMNDDAVEWDIPEDIAPALEQIGTTDITIEQCLAAGASGVLIPNETYHALDGISGSNLALLAESNKHLDNKRLFNLGDSPALVFGSLFHTLVLEPHDAENRYVVMPNFETKAVTGISIAESTRNFYTENSGKIIVTNDDMEKAKRMAINVRAIAGDIIDAGIKERSLFVEIDGLILKCRLDIDIEDEGDDYDLKSISLGMMKEFSNRTLEDHIKKLHYHWSAAFRNIIRRALGKPVRDSYLIFCNTGMGNMVRIIKIASEWVDLAEAEVSDMLEGRRFYLASNVDVPVIEITDRQIKYNEY